MEWCVRSIKTRGRYIRAVSSSHYFPLTAKLRRMGVQAERKYGLEMGKPEVISATPPSQ